jgi:hypothetical protein
LVEVDHDRSLCPDEPGVLASGGDQRALIARLRVVIEAKDAMLRLSWR